MILLSFKAINQRCHESSCISVKQEISVQNTSCFMLGRNYINALSILFYKNQ